MEDIPVEKIIRSRRRTLALEITPSATLIVRAPLRASTSAIEETIRQKSSWILRKFDEMKKRPPLRRIEYAEGELFLFLGRSYPLHIVEEGSMTIERSDKLYVSLLLMPEIRSRLKCWYIEEARKELQTRCMWFSLQTGYTPAAVRVSDAQKRWGSCTQKGIINFSWRLIQAPPEIVDYVVVHELVHLSQPDHSKKFWAKIKRIMPDYEWRRKWLHENERLLNI
jgi:predicted metal-dependent hydrolase